MTASQLSACGRDKSIVEGIPRSDFGAESTAEEVTSGVNLNGKVAVVTGCTSGIGLETMRVLAGRGAHVIGTSRSMDRATRACRSVVGITSPVQLDLEDFDSVVDCAETIRAMRKPVEILICNAGYLGGGNRLLLSNGLEKHFVTNYLGHFILVNRLLDRLFIAAQARIVMVASSTAYTDAPAEGILFDDLEFSSDYEDMRAYGHSNLAKVLFSLQLSRLLWGTRISVNSLHPGIIDTELDRHFSAIKQFGLKVFAAVRGKSIEQGASTTCYLATNDQLSNVSGTYFEDCNAVDVGGHHHMRDVAMAERLMAVTEERVADYLVDLKRPTQDNLFNDPVEGTR